VNQKATSNSQLLHEEYGQGRCDKLCEHTRELLFELNAAGETTNDLLANLIEALKEAPDHNFQRWLSNQVDLWSMRKLDWKQDGSDLMDEAEIYYLKVLQSGPIEMQSFTTPQLPRQPMMIQSYH